MGGKIMTYFFYAGEGIFNRIRRRAVRALAKAVDR